MTDVPTRRKPGPKPAGAASTTSAERMRALRQRSGDQVLLSKEAVADLDALRRDKESRPAAIARLLREVIANA